MNKICFGCGSKLQSENQEKQGYVPSIKFDSSVYCQRCFKMKHYGVVSESSTPKETNVIISSINKDDKFVIFLADFLSLNTEIINIFHSIKKRKLLIISKADIIPKSIKLERIKEYLINSYNIDSDIRFVSAVNNYGVDALTNYLKKRNIESAYVVGLSNSGKSTLINKMIKINNSNMREITTSYIPNTTLDFIRIKINEELTIIDSPGFIIPSVQSEIIIKKNNLKTFLKPKTFQMKSGETLFIEDMFLQFNSDTSITCYVSPSLKIKKYFKEVDFDNEVSVDKNNDLIISGVGFINIKNNVIVKMSNIKKEFVETRPSIFGVINE